MPIPTPAPRGDLSSYSREPFQHASTSHDIYRKGKGPAVLVITEMPGISPEVVGFADRIVALGCTAVLPDLFGEAGRDPESGSPLARLLYLGRSMASVCVRRELISFVAGRTAPGIGWLRALGEHEHARCGGPGIGVIGMCFSGGFALGMAVDPRVLVPVLSQPSQPLGLGRSVRHGIDCSDADLSVVATRCARDGLRVLGLRFEGDPFVPGERFDFLRERLGDGFIGVELSQADGHPDSPMPRHHSVLTRDLIDDPGTPTRAALDRVLALLRSRLLPA